MCYTDIKPFKGKIQEHYYRVVIIHDDKYYGLYTFSALSRDRWVTAKHVCDNESNIPKFIQVGTGKWRGHAEIEGFSGFGLFKTYKHALSFLDDANNSDKYQYRLITVSVRGKARRAVTRPVKLGNHGIPCFIFNQIKVIN